MSKRIARANNWQMTNIHRNRHEKIATVAIVAAMGGRWDLSVCLLLPLILRFNGSETLILFIILPLPFSISLTPWSFASVLNTHAYNALPFFLFWPMHFPNEIASIVSIQTRLIRISHFQYFLCNFFFNITIIT